MVYNAANSQQSNTYQYPTDKKVRKLFEVPAYLCMYVCIYVCIYVFVYVCIYLFVCVCMYVCICVCLYVCVYIHIYVCVYVSTYVCMYVFVYVYVCMYLCMYVCQAIYLRLMVITSFNSVYTTALRYALCRLKTENEAGCMISIICYLTTLSVAKSLFIPQSVLTTVPHTLPKPVLLRVWSSASSFKLQYPLFPVRSSNSCLRLIPRLPINSFLSYIFHSIMCLISQFQRERWPIQSAFPLLIVCMIFLSSLTLCNTSSFITRSVHLVFSTLLLHHISNFSRYFWSPLPSMPLCSYICWYSYT